MATKKKETAIETKSHETAMANYQDYGTEEGDGFEDQDASDNAIPFIEILQPTSKWMAEHGEEHEARAGMLRNTVSDECFAGKEGILAVCAYTKRVVVEWKPRDEGGGYKGEHEIRSEIVERAKAQGDSKFGPWKTDDGNDLVETVYGYYVQVDPDGRVLGAFTIGFAATQMKPYRKINTKLSTYRHRAVIDGQERVQRPPMYAHLLRITTEHTSNDKGSWFLFNIQPSKGDVQSSLLPTNAEAFQAGKALKEAVKSGERKANTASQGGAEGDGEVPF